MRKYKVSIHTTCNDFLPEVIFDEFALAEFRKMLGEDETIIIEDDTEDIEFYIQKCHIVGIEIKEQS